MTKLELKTLLLKIASEAYSAGCNDTCKVYEKINAKEYIQASKVLYLRTVVSKYESKEYFKGDLTKKLFISGEEL